MSSSESREAIRRLALRDGWLCAGCGGVIEPALPRMHELAATVDHIIPRGKGGTNKFSNLRLAHRVCNRALANHAVAPPVVIFPSHAASPALWLFLGLMLGTASKLGAPQ